MTVAMAPHVGFTVAALKGSVRIDLVNGRKRYVAVDRVGRAVVGPLAKRRKKLFGKKPVVVTGSRLMTGDEMAAAQGMQGMAASLRKAFQPPSQPPAPQEPKKPSLWSRLKARVAGAKDAVVWRVYDHDWHKAVQHVACDIITWTICIGIVSCVAKLLVWTWL